METNVVEIAIEDMAEEFGISPREVESVLVEVSELLTGETSAELNALLEDEP
jgi:formylmethanofuran dehydrogenase subunit A